jgi:hypothetical protein
MATTRYKIAEQVLRIVNGGDPTEDSSIDIREVMILVDQERDSLIKSEIMDWMYTKSTTTAKGELEIDGGWISQATVPIVRDASRNGALVGALDFSYVSLPNDMGIQRVENVITRFTKQGDVFKIKGSVKPTTYNTSEIDIQFLHGPKVLDKKYTISFDFHLTKTLMSNELTEQHQYAGVRTHKIQFNVDTSDSSNFENNNLNFIKSLVNSVGFQKFVKDFDIKYGDDLQLPEDNNIFDTASSLSYTSSVTLKTKYGSRIDNFNINAVGDNGINDGTDSEYGGASIGQNTEITNSLGLGWKIENKGGSNNSSEPLVTAHENSHGIAFMINDTMYSSEFVAPTTEITHEDIIDKFILENAYKLSKEQNIICQKGTLGLGLNVFTLTFEEIKPQGGYNIQPFTPGDAFTITKNENASPKPSPAAEAYEQIIFHRMPSGGEHNSLYDKTVNKTGRQYYYIENLVNFGASTGLQGGAAIYLYKRYDLDSFTGKYGGTLRVSYIGTSSKIEDHSLYPIPADYEKIIIRNLVELLAVMKNANDDMANDNID